MMMQTPYSKVRRVTILLRGVVYLIILLCIYYLVGPLQTSLSGSSISKDSFVIHTLYA